MSGEVISLRRYFHQNPELGFEEYKTSEKICGFLKSAGIPYEIKAKTGVVGHLEGKGQATIGLRADMDALSVEEETQLPFSSVNKGVMHACGHDGHMAAVLGAAKILKKVEKHLKVDVRLIFQPSEEKPPGGAQAMIKEGVLDDVDYMLGFHFFPMLPLFKVWIGEGPVMANTDFFRVRVIGRGGHGSSPQTAKDPVVCSAYLITNLQTIVSRMIDPMQASVVSVCQISAGTGYNIIPEEAELGGTVRTFDDSVRKTIQEGMKIKIEDICHSFGCRAEFAYDNYVPSCVNDRAFSKKIKETAVKILAPSEVADFHPVMGGEDFAFFSRVKPSCYMFVGIGDKFAPNHSSRFSIDERTLPYTAGFFASLLAELDMG